MKYTVRKSLVWIVGRNWMPGCVCGQTKTLTAYDIDNIRDRVEPGITRDNVEAWLACNAGDFQCVTDFSASIEDGENSIEIPWQSEDGEMAFNDCFAECED